MSDNIFRIVYLLIPVMCAIITGFIIPYIKTKITEAQMVEITSWVIKAVEAAEVLFNIPKSGEEKREYVINFIDKMFNKKKEIITKDQIRVLLESAWREMKKG